MANSKVKRKNFSNLEKDILLQLVKKDIKIIEIRGNGAKVVQQKNRHLGQASERIQ